MFISVVRIHVVYLIFLIDKEISNKSNKDNIEYINRLFLINVFQFYFIIQFLLMITIMWKISTPTLYQP